jgi:putative membrane protein
MSAHGGAHVGGHPAGAGDALSAHLPVLVLVVVGTGYALLAVRARSRQGWAARRTAAFVAGLALLGVALSPKLDGLADTDFSWHAAQHLLLAMLAPLFLVLGTPVTLLLRTLPHTAARRLGSLLNTAPVHVVTHPVVALALSSGGLVLLYVTPLYQLGARNAGVHLLIHVHLVASGFLFAWVVAGLDPHPRRASIRTRLIVLGVAIAVHASVSQLLYAGLLVDVHEPVAQMRAAGNLMYVGGDIVELLLALALLLTARPGGRRTEARPEPAGESSTSGRGASRDRRPDARRTSVET